MSTAAAVTSDVLRLDPATAAAEIESAIRDIVFNRLRRRGAVLGLSGGVDSSVTAALCARALGPGRVLALLMPERECSSESLALGRLVASHFGIEAVTEDITAILEAAGCYPRRDACIRTLMPAYDPGFRCKIVLSDVVAGSGYPIWSLVVQSPAGEISRCRLTARSYLGIVAAMNFKQRVRKMMEYYYADLKNFAVAGTPNRLEVDQGFFVKNGDGAADFKPIAHLYKSQVYQLAEYLGVPDEVRRRPPSTDTYSMEQSQEEFFFTLPFDRMDLCLWARNHDAPPEALAASGMTADAVRQAYRMIDAKRKATRYLHLPPLLITAGTPPASSEAHFQMGAAPAPHELSPAGQPQAVPACCL